MLSRKRRKYTLYYRPGPFSLARSDSFQQSPSDRDGDSGQILWVVPARKPYLIPNAVKIAHNEAFFWLSLPPKRLPPN